MTHICPTCGFPAKSPSGLVNHERQRGCLKLKLKYRSMQEEGVFGDLGALAYDSKRDKVQCHICSKWFHFLPGHLRVHEINALAYKEEFGLNRNHPLCGKENSRYRSNLCKRLREVGKFKLLPPPPQRDFERRLETKLKTARRERSVNERVKLAIATKSRLKRCKRQCIRCGANFWLNVLREQIKAKYCLACRHIVKLERRNEYGEGHYESILQRGRLLRLIKKEGSAAQAPADWAEYTHKLRSDKAKEFWQRPNAYNKRSCEIKCSSCGETFQVLAFNKRVCVCPECRLVTRNTHAVEGRQPVNQDFDNCGQEDEKQNARYKVSTSKL